MVCTVKAACCLEIEQRQYRQFFQWRRSDSVKIKTLFSELELVELDKDEK